MKPKVLLDTTYILPLFGIAIDIPGFEAGFPKLLKKASVAVNSLSILESKWKVLKISDREPKVLERFSEGLLSLTAAGEIEIIEFHLPRIDVVATSLYSSHKDYFDCSIASTAILFTDFLLTEDEALISLVNRLTYNSEVAKARTGLKTKAEATKFDHLTASLKT